MTRLQKLAAAIVITALAFLALTQERPAGACVVSSCFNHRIFICCSGSCWSMAC
jgi:hypothetical protein